jgi:hypothetical protein
MNVSNIPPPPPLVIPPPPEQPVSPEEEKAEFERYLVTKAHALRHDPYGFVRFAFEATPEPWQEGILLNIGEQLCNQHINKFQVIQEAISSGNGSGKSALVSWIILWAMTTEVGCKGVVTANTESQLRTKTFSELAKWYSRSKYKHWFNLTATSLISANHEHSKTWRFDAIPWSLNNPEAFAGMHNEGSRVLLMMDEASAIPNIIWETAEGALTDKDTEIIWVVAGNPTRNTGRFRECFSKFRHRWHCLKVDTRKVSHTNKNQIRQWLEDHGEDSDFFKVRVRGEFPDLGSRQFIAMTTVDEAIRRENIVPFNTPKILAVDVARFGDDASVISRRHGRKLEKLIRYHGLDTMELSSEVSALINKYKPDAVFVDGVGVGGGVVDRLRQLGHSVIEVIAGLAPSPDKQDPHKNRRAEMYDLMRDWLETGDIPDDAELKDDLVGIEYYYDDKMRIQIEKKEEMKARGMQSPDNADSLSLGFFTPVVTKLDETLEQQYLEPGDFYDN